MTDDKLTREELLKVLEYGITSSSGAGVNIPFHKISETVDDKGRRYDCGTVFVHYLRDGNDLVASDPRLIEHYHNEHFFPPLRINGIFENLTESNG